MTALIVNNLYIDQNIRYVFIEQHYLMHKLSR